MLIVLLEHRIFIKIVMVKTLMQELNYDQIEAMEKQNWWYQGKRDLFRQILRGQKRKFDSALDIGCGVGSNMQVLSEFSSQVEGVDLSEKAVMYCKERGISTVSVGNVCDLNLGKKYDLVLCSELLEHVDDGKALKEIATVMESEGMFVFSVPAHMYLWNDNDEISEHLRRYEKERLRSLLSADFKIVKLSYWNSTLFLPTYLFYKLRKLRKRREVVNNLTLVPGMFNGILEKILKVENKLFTKMNMPQGISLVGVCVRK
jgi:2-polyprenyl-3-methyl-5-hydroxy-6-metoxy-1,4-benzoquinol methylase